MDVSGKLNTEFLLSQNTLIFRLYYLTYQEKLKNNAIVHGRILIIHLTKRLLPKHSETKVEIFVSWK